jgi:drug/metabolite transporter (DMT)-like permease
MAPTQNARQAIALMALGTFMLTVQDAVSKGLLEYHSVGEILFYRGIWAYVPIAWFIWRGGGLRLLRTNNPRANLARSVLNTAAGVAIISAFGVMPLASALSIMFASPLLVSALSGTMLGEQVGVRRWIAVMIGFFGVVLMLQPQASALGWYIILPVAAAVFVAFRDILTRRLGATDDPTTILFYTITVSVVAGAIWMAVFGASWPAGWTWLVFIVTGFINALAHFVVIKAFSLTQASTLMPLRYLSLVWAGGIGYMVWGDVPHGIAILGAVLIVTSGLIVVTRSGR